MRVLTCERVGVVTREKQIPVVCDAQHPLDHLDFRFEGMGQKNNVPACKRGSICLLYTSDAADE